MKRVAVIGGGVSGLCAARQLARDGRVDVQLYEAGDRLGGVIRSSHQDGYLYEWAANAFLPAPDGAIELAAELGVAMAPAAAAAKKRWVYVDGAARPVPTDPVSAIRTSLLSTPGKLRLLAEPLARRASSADESVAAFARRRLGAEAARKLIAPFVTGVFAGDAELLSLRAAFPVLGELDDQGGLVRGMVARMRRARGEGNRKRERPRLSAPVAGVQALVDAVAAEVGARAHTGAQVQRLARSGAGVTIDVAGSGSQQFDLVVLATPAPASSALVAELSPALSQTLAEIPYVSVAIVHVAFERAQIGHALDGFGIIVAKGEVGVRVLGVVLESVLWSNRAPARQVLVRCIYGGERDPGAVDESDATLLEHARRDLRTLLGIDCAPLHHHIARQRSAIAQYTLGHLDRVERAERLAEPLGIVLAGAAYHGVSVNKCVADAARVAGCVYRVLQLALLCLVLVVAACSGKSEQSAPDPVATAVAFDARRTQSADAGGSARKPTRGGALSVTVDWLAAPARLRGSPGRTRCQSPRRAPVVVHTNGGVSDIVVSLLGVSGSPSGAGAGVTELAIRDCELSPPVAKLARLGGTVAIINDDERRHELVVESLAGVRVADIPLAVMGRRFEFVPKQPGILRVRDLADDANVAYVIVPAHDYVAITNDTGSVELGEVPAGSYRVQAWQRPLALSLPPTVVVASVDIVAGAAKKLRLSLAQ